MDSGAVLSNPNITNLDNDLSQSDFIKNELNFDVDPNDPLTKASLVDHPVNEWMDILGNGQLEKKVLVPGRENSRPNKGDICTLQLTGKLEDGTVVEQYDKLEIQLGDSEVIQGLDLAIALMDTEEEAELRVDSRFAYGDLGKISTDSLPEIPPKSKILYNVKLINVELEPEIYTFDVTKKREIGNKKRERGNWWFSRNEATIAIQCYRRALEYLSSANTYESSDETESPVNPPSNEELQALLEDSLKVHNNLAAAQIKIQAFDAALNSVDSVLRCQPKNVKALFRKGKILHSKGEHAKACSVLTQALKIEPENRAVQQELSILKQKSARDARHEKNLYRKMLSTPTSDKNKNNNLKKDKKQKNNSNITWGLIGGTAVAIVGLLAYRFIS